MLSFPELHQDLMFPLPEAIKEESTIRMKDNIIIKQFPNGLTLHLNPDISFEKILEELALKFASGRQFFRNARIALAIEGYELTQMQERQIISTIKDNSDLEIICIVGKNEETERNFVKAIQKVNLQHTDNFGHFYRGSLKNSW